MKHEGELSSATKPPSVGDRSKSAKEEIESARSEIEALELEDQLAELAARRDRLIKKRSVKTEREPRCEQERDDRDLSAHGPREDGHHSRARAHADRTVGHSSYGTRSRRRSRGRRHRRSTSDSRSRSSSSARRRKSKWSLKRFTFDDRDVRKLNGYGIIAATTEWALDIDALTVKDYKALFEHINFIAVRAIDSDFKDTAHVAYDSAVRKKAAVYGFSAFSEAYNGGSVIHYGTQHLKSKKGGAAGSGRSSGTSDRKRPCFRWNKESGCGSSEDSCSYAHVCSKCWSKSHKRIKCTRD